MNSIKQLALSFDLVRNNRLLQDERSNLRRENQKNLGSIGKNMLKIEIVMNIIEFFRLRSNRKQQTVLYDNSTIEVPTA